MWERYLYINNTLLRIPEDVYMVIIGICVSMYFYDSGLVEVLITAYPDAYDDCAWEVLYRCSKTDSGFINHPHEETTVHIQNKAVYKKHQIIIAALKHLNNDTKP